MRTNAVIPCCVKSWYDIYWHDPNILWYLLAWSSCYNMIFIGHRFRNDHCCRIMFFSNAIQIVITPGSGEVMFQETLALSIFIAHDVMFHCFHCGISVYTVWLSLSLLHSGYQERHCWNSCLLHGAFEHGSP